MASARPADTIAAIATAPGRGGVGIVRISGPLAGNIALAMLDQCPAARRAEYLPFRDIDGAVLDTGLALYFPNPHSFTGEDVLELHAHGGPVVLDLILQQTLHHGARLARPGEFAERAFLNDKIDLAQAEAIADLIEAGTEQAARCATASLQGVFSDWVHSTVAALTQLRMYVEAAIDFPEEEIDFLADAHISGEVARLLQEIQKVIKVAQQGQLLREGLRIVLAGQPNTGKSSLLNALAGRDSAIVTDVPGTTRDVLKEEINIEGMPLHIIDTAGLRDSRHAVEQEGIRRSWQQIEQADAVLLMIDDRQGFGEQEAAIVARLPAALPVLQIHNKIDLSGNPVEVSTNKHGAMIRISARGSQGIELLQAQLKTLAGFQTYTEGLFTARRRHLDALRRAQQHVQSGQQQLSTQKAGELLAEELRLAQVALGEITGEISSDDLLGMIFSSFCIGK